MTGSGLGEMVGPGVKYFYENDLSHRDVHDCTWGVVFPGGRPQPPTSSGASEMAAMPVCKNKVSLQVVVECVRCVCKVQVLGRHKPNPKYPKPKENLFFSSEGWTALFLYC